MSSLFDSYRSVGLVTSGRMTRIRRLGDVKNFTTCPAGRTFYVYNCDKLHVAMISQQVPTNDDISVVAAIGADTTIVAAGKRLFKYERAECIGEFESEDDGHETAISQICSFGNGDIVITVDSSGRMISWNVSSLKPSEMPVIELGTDFRAKFLLHPRTYLNKLLVGGEAGLLQLWNIRTGKLVHSFQGFSELGIECAEQSPAVDVVALGLSDGTIKIHNLRFDRTLFEIKHSSKQRVTSLAFLENADGVPVLLASGTSEGEIAIWDLNTRAILHNLVHAHSGAVIAMDFIPGDFAILTCGRDNALRTWALDAVSYQPSLLKAREGHWRAPNKVRFHPHGATIATLASGTDGRALQVITAGRDRTVRTFHCARDSHARELSQKCEEQRLPPVTSIATSEAREKDWFNVVTTHEGESVARVWRFEHNSLGEGKLHMRSKGYSVISGSKRKRGGNDSDWRSTAVSCAISDCGNYAFVGSASGIVSKYNLQSGRFLGAYPAQVWDQTADSSRAAELYLMKRRKKTAAPASVYATTGEARTDAFSVARDASERHRGAVTGVCIDGLGDFVFSSGLDGVIRVWDADSFEAIDSVSVDSAVKQMERSRDGGLIALALENMSVCVVDAVSRRVVRKFNNCHNASLTDICFSPDSKWLLSASLDQTLRVWDLSTARCVDWISFPAAITSLSFSPSNEYLATSHVDCLAVCLWVNKVHYGLAKADRVAQRSHRVDLPCFKHTSEDEDIDEETSAEAVQSENEVLVLKPTRDQVGMVSLSEPSVAASRWFTLWHVDLIKERNKPIQPVQKPEQVPFFLPTTAAELDLMQLVKKDENDKNDGKIQQSRIFAGTDSLLATRSPIIAELEELVATLKARDVQKDSYGIDDDDLDENERFRLTNVQRASSFAEFVEKLKSMSASAVDFEVRSLSFGPEDEDGARAIEAFLDWLLVELQARTNFEMVQSLLGRVIRLHGDTLKQRDELKRVLKKLQNEQRLAWTALQGMIHKSICYVESFSQLSGF